MKMRTFLLLLWSPIFFGCIERDKPVEYQDAEADAIPIDSNSLWIDSAKAILKRNNELIKKGIAKEMSSDDVNAIVNPSMDIYFQLIKKIDPKDTLSINEYRIELINELVDFQIKRSR